MGYTIGSQNYYFATGYYDNYVSQKFKILEICQSYKEAFSKYADSIKERLMYPPKDMWIAWIRSEDDKIIQIDRLVLEHKSQIIEKEFLQ